MVIRVHPGIPDEETCLKCHNDDSPFWDPKKYELAAGGTAGFDFDQANEEIAHMIPEDVKGKYIETPSGIYELRYFFTGGVDNADGEIESRRNVCRRIGELVEGENKKKPHSDTALARLLQDEGRRIARRTVTKYREQADIPASRLRRLY